VCVCVCVYCLGGTCGMHEIRFELINMKGRDHLEDRGADG
jgi:hypothetical protein